MYRKVVVPLDGSALAEAALPHLEEIAKGCAIPEVMLVSVTERIRGRMGKAATVEEGPAEEFHMTPSANPLPLGTTYSGALFSPAQQDPGAETET